MVECLLAKEEVASSNLVSRSIYTRGQGQSGSATNLGGATMMTITPGEQSEGFLNNTLRQRSARLGPTSLERSVTKRGGGLAADRAVTNKHPKRSVMGVDEASEASRGSDYV